MYVAKRWRGPHTAAVGDSSTAHIPGTRSLARHMAVLREQPRGLYLVSITEFWERFSYYGMLGLLVLFLTASPASGGFGWHSSDALLLYALYTGAVFSAPAAGGWIASRWLGERRCIFWGALCVTAGHFCLAGPALLPALIASLTAHPVSAWLQDCGITLGQLVPDGGVRAAIESGRCAREPAGAGAFALAYRSQAWSLVLGLALIVAGTGFIKATVSSIVGRLYDAADRRREEGFAIFYAFIYLGALLSNFVAGTLGEKLGWHYGFAAAGVGMALGFTWYLARHRSVLGDVGMKPDHLAAAPAPADPAQRTRERHRIALILIMSVFVIVYAMAFYQKGGLLNLETRNHVDRHVLGFEVPATWLLSMSTLVFILLSIPAARLWRHLETRGRQPDAVFKLGAGLAVLALSYLVLVAALGEKTASATQQFSLWWMVLVYTGFALGDLLVWPAQIAAVNRLAPARHASFAIGGWHLTIGIGSWLTAVFGALGARSGTSVVAWTLAGICGAGALLLLANRARLSALSHGALDGK